ncbi:5640_t:CDS:2, partial [Entrophospora sp. SA101]
KYPTPEAKAAVKRIGPSQNLPKRIGDDLLSAVSKGRDLSSVFSSFFDNAINKNNQLEDNLNLEGSLSFKGFINLEELDISNQKITALDIADCSQLRDLNCSNNQLTNLDLANNQQIEQINFSSNQLTNLNLKGLTKIEKIFCSGNKLANLEFLKDIDPTKVLTLRMDNNNFPAQDLSCFTPFTKLQRLFITNNPFYGSLKPLRNLTEIKEIGITGTNVNSGLENLHEDFFKVNAVNNAASSLGLTGGYFKRIIQCSEKLAEQLKDYEEKNIESLALNKDHPAAEIYNHPYSPNTPPLIKGYENISKRKIKLSPNIDNLDNYLKPYDIVKRKMSIPEDFLKGETEIEIEHPFIPFKRLELIEKQIDIAIKAKYGEKQYHLLKNNCEHFAKMCVYGLGISQQSKMANAISKDSAYLLKAIQETNDFFEKLQEKEILEKNSQEDLQKNLTAFNNQPKRVNASPEQQN